ncbi:hypothetical protein Nepgr_014561 [Nepenthes gracilis]|uniref:Tetratricopeptide repeat-like superfamily protein n=1 Tax=Nepenthes gracilis TaxID=150966 RepID=A0AAD3XQL2_NEPGR|nr:hypothetical protein Nepgr_014561 [Nepenthes gracilis]
MEVKVATTCLQWSQPSVPRSPSTHTLPSAVSSSSSRRRSEGNDGAQGSRCMHKHDRSSLFGTSPSKLYRVRSCEFPKPRVHTIRRARSESFDAFSEEKFAKKIQELSLRFQLSDDDDDYSSNTTENTHSETLLNYGESEREDNRNEIGRIDASAKAMPPVVESLGSRWLEIHEDTPDWPARDKLIPSSIQSKANSVYIPLSLRNIKSKKQWQEEFLDAGESAYCSVQKAFSSMVFIIRELHCFALQMREHLFYEDLQGIWARVQKELHDSFVWLFQRVFSHTPTLMVYVMILLANFTVHSLSTQAAIAVPFQFEPQAATTESVSLIANERTTQTLGSDVITSSSGKSSGGMTTSIDGINGSGGKVRPAASEINDDGWFGPSLNCHRTIVPDGGVSQVSSFTNREDESVSAKDEEEEAELWNSLVEEASTMQAQLRDDALDHETLQRFVSPVVGKIEDDDYGGYFRTDLLYQTSLANEPDNPLLLANYAQFLYLVIHDYNRAEEYFKRAIGIEPKDAEAHSKYANFLWQVRKDLWAAEEAFLEAISADPSNSYYAANYAHFLWSTGGEDTCFPLAPPDDPLDA